MSAHTSPSTSSVPPNAPPSLSPTLPSTTSSLSNSHPSPTMLSSSSSVHSPETRRQIAEARTALEASMTNIGSSLDTQLKSRAQNLHDNSKQLEKQQKDVVKATEGLRKETDRLKKVADEGMRRVKELGNVQNWAEMLERDFLVLGETIRLANLPSESGSEWETEGSQSDDEDHKMEDGKLDDVHVVHGLQHSDTLDHEGDTQMGDAHALSKGKAVDGDELHMVTHEHAEIGDAGSSTATATGSGSDPSSSSIRTAASVATS